MSKQRTFMAHNGDVWRNSHAPYFHWHSLLPQTCVKLLAGFRQDQATTSDWFHKRAGELADELQAAMAQAEAQRKGRHAA